MEYFTESAVSHREVLHKIKEKYGDRARILTQRNVRMGGFMGMFSREGIEVSGYIARETPRPRKILDDEEEKRKILHTIKDSSKDKDDTGEQTLKEVLERLSDIQGRLGTQAEDARDETHPAIREIENLLEDNEFSASYIREICDRLRRELSLEELDQQELVESRVFSWIGDKIRIYEAKKTPKIMILIGPTGVGKTTTIAKLAAIYGLGHKGGRPIDVRMITIDNYRIGAKQQIDTYGSIMNIPVSGVESYDDFKKQLAMYDGTDLILVDTIGKSPRDYMKLAEMRKLLDACGTGSEVFLTLSSTTKVSDIRELFKTFGPFGYEALILTKLDETLRIGNVLSVLAEQDKPVAFLTDGQTVPQDIHEASVSRLMMNLNGFKTAKNNMRPSDGRGPGAAKSAEYVKNGVWE